MLYLFFFICELSYTVAGFFIYIYIYESCLVLWHVFYIYIYICELSYIAACVFFVCELSYIAACVFFVFYM